MNFKKARNTEKQQKTTSLEMKVIDAKKMKKSNEKIISIIVIITLFILMVLAGIRPDEIQATYESPIGPEPCNSMVMMPMPFSEVSTTTTKFVTTTTAKPVTTKVTTVATTTSSMSTTTTTTATIVTEDVPATERSVETEKVVTSTKPSTPTTEPKTETSITTEPSSEEVTKPVIVIEVEEPMENTEIEYIEEPSEQDITPVQVQEYYSDDGDYGWSHIPYRYATPDLSADQERYHAANEYVTEEERIYLVNIVASEYGSDYVPVYEKAKVVAVVMNRLQNGYWGDSIYSVLTYPGQFSGYSAQSWFYRSTTPTCIDAVDYYFLHKDEWQYSGIQYISGGGGWNAFS